MSLSTSSSNGVAPSLLAELASSSSPAAGGRSDVADMSSSSAAGRRCMNRSTARATARRTSASARSAAGGGTSSSHAESGKLRHPAAAAPQAPRSASMAASWARAAASGAPKVPSQSLHPRRPGTRTSHTHRHRPPAQPRRRTPRNTGCRVSRNLVRPAGRFPRVAVAAGGGGVQAVEELVGSQDELGSCLIWHIVLSGRQSLECSGLAGSGGLWGGYFGRGKHTGESHGGPRRAQATSDQTPVPNRLTVPVACGHSLARSLPNRAPKQARVHQRRHEREPGLIIRSAAGGGGLTWARETSVAARSGKRPQTCVPRHLHSSRKRPGARAAVGGALPAKLVGGRTPSSAVVSS
uniref:Uncharacterized protein n=1 Tax=Setaria italica TaxID=4555 RepID=K3YM07_SETIT